MTLKNLAYESFCISVGLVWLMFDAMMFLVSHVVQQLLWLIRVCFTAVLTVVCMPYRKVASAFVASTPIGEGEADASVGAAVNGDRTDLQIVNMQVAVVAAMLGRFVALDEVDDNINLAPDDVADNFVNDQDDDDASLDTVLDVDGDEFAFVGWGEDGDDPREHTARVLRKSLRRSARIRNGPVEPDEWIPGFVGKRYLKECSGRSGNHPM